MAHKRKRAALLASPDSARGYHSSALLLSSGRVLSGGGNSRISDCQVFEPPCLQTPFPRPVITSVSGSNPLGYGAPSTVDFTLASGAVKKAVLMRPGSATHHSTGSSCCERPAMIPSTISLSLLLGALTTQVPFATFEGSHRNEQLGYVVRFAGDVNADGYDDILVTAPFPLKDYGYAHVYSGADGAELHRWKVIGPFAAIGSVDAAGDMDFDGYDDVILGGLDLNSSGSGFTGKTAVVSGRTGKVIHLLESQVSWTTGGSVTGGGDVNGDGWPDVVLGAPRWPNRTTRTYGRVGVYPGNPVLSAGSLQAGSAATLEGKYFEPGAKVWLAYSLTGLGSTPLPQLGVTADLDQPIVAGGPRFTDAFGQVSWTLPIPPGSSGRNVWFQVVQKGTKSWHLGGFLYGRKSNVVAAVVQ